MLSTSATRSLIHEDTTGKALSETPTDTKRLRQRLSELGISQDIWREYKAARKD